MNRHPNVDSPRAKMCVGRRRCEGGGAGYKLVIIVRRLSAYRQIQTDVRGTHGDDLESSSHTQLSYTNIVIMCSVSVAPEAHCTPRLPIYRHVFDGTSYTICLLFAPNAHTHTRARTLAHQLCYLHY
jgi:hypothetical protein